MLEINFLKEVCTATTFLRYFKDFRAELEYLKNVQAVTFSKIHIVIYFHPSDHYLSLLTNGFLSFVESCFLTKTLIVGFFTI